MNHSRTVYISALSRTVSVRSASCIVSSGLIGLRAATQVGQITRPEPEPAPPLPLSLSLCCSQTCTFTMFDSCNNVAPCFRPERKKCREQKKTEAHSSNIQREEGAEGRKEQRGGRSSLTLRGAWGRAERRAGHGGENGWWKVGQREQLRG